MDRGTWWAIVHGTGSYLILGLPRDQSFLCLIDFISPRVKPSSTGQSWLLQPRPFSEELRGMAWECTHDFHSHSMEQNSIIWQLLAPREAENVVSN